MGSFMECLSALPTMLVRVVCICLTFATIVDSKIVVTPWQTTLASGCTPWYKPAIGPGTKRFCSVHNFDVCTDEYYESDTLPVWKAFPLYLQVLQFHGRLALRNLVNKRRRMDRTFDPTVNFICLRYYPKNGSVYYHYKENFWNYVPVQLNCSCSHYGLVSTYESFFIASTPIMYKDNAEILSTMYRVKNPYGGIKLFPHCTAHIFNLTMNYSREYWAMPAFEDNTAIPYGKIDPFSFPCYFMYSCLASNEIVVLDWVSYRSGPYYNSEQDCPFHHNVLIRSSTTTTTTRTTPLDTTTDWVDSPSIVFLTARVSTAFLVKLAILIFIFFVITTLISLVCGLRRRRIKYCSECKPASACV